MYNIPELTDLKIVSLVKLVHGTHRVVQKQGLKIHDLCSLICFGKERSICVHLSHSLGFISQQFFVQNRFRGEKLYMDKNTFKRDNKYLCKNH